MSLRSFLFSFWFYLFFFLFHSYLEFIGIKEENLYPFCFFLAKLGGNQFMLVHGGAVIHPNKLLTELMDRPIFAFVRVESL